MPPPSLWKLMPVFWKETHLPGKGESCGTNRSGKAVEALKNELEYPKGKKSID